ncbi:hypothetical protein [Desulfonatronovibrio hydrogenovorans]|uniref:hypothetical protein n=1 Tax=Desulfonatronovibrio hydrogenovorans TaxID=53245 RepID=UPI00048AC5FD|nr:hypothetical protein [Desulfonatronovibrio hydrogenovorans]
MLKEFEPSRDCLAGGESACQVAGRSGPDRLKGAIMKFRQVSREEIMMDLVRKTSEVAMYGVFEMIQVRAFNESSRQEALAEARMLSLGDHEGLDSINVLIRNDWETDIVVILSRQEESGTQSFSEEGLGIAESFSRFGWLTHSSWRLDKVNKKLNSNLELILSDWST